MQSKKSSIEINTVQGENNFIRIMEKSSNSIMNIIWTILLLGSATQCDARVAGKIGIYTNNYSGKSSTGINEEIIWVSIGMGITIAILITIALCYILIEKCKKRRDYFANT